MEIIDLLSDENIWNDFLLRKESQGTIARRELDYLRSFIAEKKYMPVAESLIRGEYSFPLPQMKEINRISSGIVLFLSWSLSCFTGMILSCHIIFIRLKNILVLRRRSGIFLLR